MSTSMTKEGYTLATQQNSTETPGFAYFSDNIRDGLKGSVFNDYEQGYVSGAFSKTATIQSCFLGMPSWCTSPSQSINYASCHDNLTLFDKLALSNPDDTVEDRIRMNNLAAAIYMTSQGVPFLQAGEEMLRSKPLDDGTFDHNSYASPDSVNSLKWDDLNDETYQQVYEYYKGLIAFRQAHPALRMTSAEEVREHITAVSGLDGNVTAFNIYAGANGEESDLFVIFNPDNEAATVTLPDGEWTIYISGNRAGTEALGTVSGEVTVEAISAMALVLTGPTPIEESDETTAPTEATEPSAEVTEPVTDGEPAAEFPTALVVGMAVLVIAGAAFILLKRKK